MPGVEVTTRDGHLLALFIEDRPTAFAIECRNLLEIRNIRPKLVAKGDDFVVSEECCECSGDSRTEIMVEQQLHAASFR